ncbi:MAG: GAF domain-containing sensor histidine kinase, partial [Candidatus Lokiarchaeota archaeon]|nr:GAF domain-containing sensor histidine kinase [Candidatus Lokiarchaeota archaeon]
MSSNDRPPADDVVEGLQREIEDLEKQLDRYRTRTNLRNNAVAEVSKAIFRLDSFESTAKMIFEACKRATGGSAGYVALLTPDGKENSIVYLDAGGLPCTVDPALPMPIRGLRAEAYKSKKPAIDNDFKDSEWMRFMPEGHAVLTSVMFAPLVVANNPRGLIGLANKPGGFTDEDAEIAMSYAEIAAIAMQSSHMIESIKETNCKLQEAYQEANLLKDLLVHDVNNVLQAISGSAALWKARIDKGLPATGIIESLDLILENVGRGAALIESIQKLEKLADPRLDLARRDIMIPLKDAIAIVNKRFFTKQIEIKIDA